MAHEELSGDMGDEGQVTFSPPFEAIKAIVEASSPPRRPNRNKPIHGLSDELDAWDAASDEALEALDDLLEE